MTGTRHWPAQQAGAEHDDDAADQQAQLLANIERFVRQRGEYQRRNEDVHVELVGEAHVRLFPAAIGIAGRHHGVDREDDRGDALQHGSSARERLQHVARQVLALGQFAQARINIGAVDGDGFRPVAAGVK